MIDPIWVHEEIVIEAHEAALADHGGVPGLLHADNLDSALYRPQQTLHCRNPQPDIIELAAMYVLALCKNHVFVDGNQRTAFYVCRIFLTANGHAFDPPTDEAVNFFAWVADNKNTRITGYDVADWLCKYSIRKD